MCQVYSYSVCVPAIISVLPNVANYVITDRHTGLQITELGSDLAYNFSHRYIRVSVVHGKVSHFTLDLSSLLLLQSNLTIHSYDRILQSILTIHQFNDITEMSEQ